MSSSGKAAQPKSGAGTRGNIASSLRLRPKAPPPTPPGVALSAPPASPPPQYPCEVCWCPHSELRYVNDIAGIQKWHCPKCLIWANIVCLSANIPEGGLREAHLLGELRNITERLVVEERNLPAGITRH